MYPKNRETAIHINMDKPGEHYVSELNQAEGKILHNITRIYSLKWANSQKQTIEWWLPKDW